LKKVIIPVIAAAIVFGVILPIHYYYPYFGLWNESQMLKGLDDYELVLRTENLDEVQMFLERHQDANVEVDREYNQVKYSAEKNVQTRFGEENRKITLQVKFDIFGNPSPYAIGCSTKHTGVAGGEDILEKIDSDWCFNSNRFISIEDQNKDE